MQSMEKNIVVEKKMRLNKQNLSYESQEKIK